MKFAIFAAVAALAVAAPQYGYNPPSTTAGYAYPTPSSPAPPPPTTPGYSYEKPETLYSVPEGRDAIGAEAEAPKEVVPILKDDRISHEDGSYSVDVETGDGTLASEAGAPGADGSIVKSGQYSYTAPDGTVIQLKFVADENGFQAESNALPVAPAFPHPIPDFVLEQIKFAEEEAARAAAEAEAEARSNLYGTPQ